ncbi:MAG TPA: hypothetical protein VGF13_13925 [Verrucomicrobiae bacterium]|jgi:hypothetical protein
MNTFADFVRREMRVALSPKAQPVWFRVLKWGFFLPFMYWLWHTRWFWLVTACMVPACLGLHLFFRWKTTGWTRPWGLWNDVKSADGASAPS